MLENLCDLTLIVNSQEVVTKGYLNLQNRNDLLLVEDTNVDKRIDTQFIYTQLVTS